MEETINLAYLNNQFLFEIIKTGKIEDWDNFLESSNSIDEIFEYFYNLEETHYILNMPPLPTKGKSEEQADRLRTKGNQYYQKSILNQALELYNDSIMAAPHPNILYQTSNEEIGLSHLTNDDTIRDGEYRCLALGFSNRSAVLFELKQYDKCMSDIEISIKYGYPKAQQHKLVTRKAKCFLALNRKKEAESIIQTTIAELYEQEVDEAKIDQIKKQLEKLLQQCQEGKSIFEIQNNKCVSGEFTKNKSYNLEFDKPVLPTLDNPNSRIPCFSDALKLEYEPSKGRFVVAERDIKPGTLMSVERAYASTFMAETIKYHCSTCFIKCDNPLPCPTCSLVVFCSENCRQSAMLGFHKVECSLLPTLINQGFTHFGMMAFRCITKIPFQKLKKEINFIKGNKEDIPSKMSGFNENGTYDSNDFKTVFSLVHNIDQSSATQLFHRCSTAFVLTKLLMSSINYFPSESGTTENIYKAGLLIGCTIMRLISNILCNTVCFGDGTLDEFTDLERSGIGLGVWPAHSLHNHSCNPTIVHHTFGNTMITYASTFIPAGSEVTVSYGYDYVGDKIKERRSCLKKTHNFYCNCDACVGGWPTFKNLPMNPSFISVRNHVDKCIDHKNPHSEDNFKENENIQNEFKVLEQKFQIAHQNIKSEMVPTEVDKQSVIIFIEFMSKYIRQPNRMFCEAQECLYKCLEIEYKKSMIKLGALSAESQGRSQYRE